MDATYKRSLILLAAVLVAAAVCFYANTVFPDALAEETAAAAEEFGVDEALVRGVIFAESGYDTDAVSRAGASGPMQLMPSTREWVSKVTGIAADGTAMSEVRLGTAYLAYLLRRFGNVETALAAYNAGPANVERWLREGEEPYPETAAYVKRVLFASRVYARVF